MTTEITINADAAYEPTVQFGRSQTYSAKWQNETYRYHVWLTVRENGQVYTGDTIYQNPIEHAGGKYKVGKFDANAASHRRIMDQVRAFATLENITKAHDAALATRKVKEQQKRHDRAEAIRAALRALPDKLVFATHSVARCTDDDLLTIAHAIDKA